MGFYDSFPETFYDVFPDNYLNNVEGWGISKEELHSRNEDGSYKLLTLDVDLGKKCSLNCPLCYKRSPSEDIKFRRNDLEYDELISLIVEAKSLGLKSIKIMGAGDPLENPNFLDFLIKTTRLGVHVAVFTKGHVIGSDELVRKVHSKYGINNGEELVNLLFDLKVSILLGFNSFEKGIQLDYVGTTGNSIIDNYYELRNNALSLLINRGFNNYIENSATRLALIAAPFNVNYLEELFEMYKWARKRNIYFVTCPTVDSGKGRKEVEKINDNYYTDYFNKVIAFYTRIYVWSITMNILSINEFKTDGPSLYPGGHPCNQTASGLYINIKGVVQRCPGFDFDNAVEEEDVRSKSLKDIWENSRNYELAKKENQFNFYCVAREVNLFTREVNFFNKIYLNVISLINGEVRDFRRAELPEFS